MAARAAKVGHSTAEYHLKNDPDFAAQAEAAKRRTPLIYCTQGAMQRCLEGDCEPVFWQGIEIGHVRKFDSRLTVELLRAHMPERFVKARRVNPKSFFAELKRRNVYKVAVAYAVVAWLFVQLARVLPR